MKTKLIISAGLLSLLAILIISDVNPVYSQGDPKCANCTKTTCDESCKDKGVCDEKGTGNCSEENHKSNTSSGIPSSSGSVMTNNGTDCTNCTLTECDESCLKQGACNSEGSNCKDMKSPMDKEGNK